jgi:hypothetical protein
MTAGEVDGGGVGGEGGEGTSDIDKELTFQ